MSSVTPLVFMLFLIYISEVYCITDDVSMVLHKVRRRETLDDVDKHVMAISSTHELPLQLKLLVRRSIEGEHLCCRNTPLPTVTKSRSSRRVIQVEDRSKTHSSCGFLATGKCSHEHVVYKQQIKYVREYYKTVVEGQCPTRHIVCCNMYIMVSGKCVHLDDLHEVTKQILG